MIDLEIENLEEPTPEKETRGKIAFRSLLDCSKMPIDATQTLLGENRWLCRGNMALWIAPSGQGKSVASVQAAILWSCGKPAFSIPTPHMVGLRVLLVQAEDDDGDVTEMAKVINHLGLTNAEKSLVERNTLHGRVNTRSGIDFLDGVLKKIVEQFKPDLLILNPLNTYLGDDDKDQKTCMSFRDGLNALMNEHRFGTIIFHHTPKPPPIGAKQSNDSLQYKGSGSALLTNWARAVIVMQKEDDGIYLFQAAKRGSRIGWGSSKERWFKHSDVPGILKWEDAEPVIKIEGTGKNSVLDLNKVLEFVPPIDPMEKDAVVGKIMRGMDTTDRAARRTLAELEADGKIFSWKLAKEDKSKRGACKEGWCRREQPSAKEIASN